MILFTHAKGLSSRQGEFHPKPLTEPYVKVSLHTALQVRVTISGYGFAIELLLLKIVGSAFLNLSAPLLQFHYKTFIATTG